MTAARFPTGEADYLAKDYESFLALVTNRLAAEVPDWTERRAADQTIAILEALSYIGDHLSYFQDAVAAEAFVETARRRISLRRLSRMLDHFISDGVSARAWIHFRISDPIVDLPQGAQVLAGGRGAAPVIAGADVSDARGPVFETMRPARLRRESNRMAFEVPPGETGGTLAGDHGYLRAGDVLWITQVVGGDGAAPHLARLSTAPVVRNGGDRRSTLVRWSAEDAPPAAFRRNGAADGAWFAAGNMVLADHGATRRRALPRVTEGDYRPELPTTALTHARAHPADDLPLALTDAFAPRAAAAAVRVERDDGRPAHLRDGFPRTIWSARRDLMESRPESRDFVVETDNGGRPRLRFGDNRYGRAPPPGASLTAIYREGCGRAGNVGAGALNQVVLSGGGIEFVANPLPASGGADPDTAADIRLAAPGAPRRPLRCVTAADYAAAAARLPGVRDAAARRGGGGGDAGDGGGGGDDRRVTVWLRRTGGAALSDPFIGCAARALAPLTLIGDDVRLAAPSALGVDVGIRVDLARWTADAETASRTALSVFIDAKPIGGAVTRDELAAVLSETVGGEARIACLSAGGSGDEADRVDARPDQVLQLADLRRIGRSAAS